MVGSNDMIKSTIHRVRAPPQASKDGITPERYSIPYVGRSSLFAEHMLTK